MICHRCGTIFEGCHLSCPSCGLDLPGSDAASPVPADELPPASRYTASVSSTTYAGFWARVAALLIDRVLLGFVNVALSLCYVVLSSTDTASEEVRAVILGSAIFGFLLRWLYSTLMESSPLQATLGKMVIGIIVTDTDSGRITLARANGRYWAKIISALPFGFGYLMAGFTSRKQALHDMIAGTFVLRK